MKIVYDYQIFCLQRYGGISRYFFELARNISKLKNSNHKVNIASIFYINNYLKKSSENFKIHGKKINLNSLFEKILTVPNKILSPCLISNLNPDILHHTYYIDQHDFLNFKGKRIITIHDLIDEKFPRKSLYSRTLRSFRAKAIKESDHIICISKNTQKDLIDIFNINEEKTSVIYHGINNSPKNTQKNLSKKKKYILYVGNRGGHKNFNKLLEAFSFNKLVNQHYKLLAFGGGEFNNEETRLIKELNIPIKKIINLQGDDILLNSLYKSASLFIYPSIYEGFGMPPLEAMSHYCPVACSNTSAIPEIVGDAALLFDPLSKKSISESMQLVLFNSELSKKLVEKGREKIKNFTWEKCCINTLKTYKKVLN